jgi:hypothetical protein
MFDKLARECSLKLANDAMLRHGSSVETLKIFFARVREEAINDCIDRIEKLRNVSPHPYIETLRDLRDKK